MPGVEQREIFEIAHCLLDHIERTGAGLQSRPGAAGDTRQRCAIFRLPLWAERGAIDDAGTRAVVTELIAQTALAIAIRSASSPCSSSNACSSSTR